MTDSRLRWRNLPLFLFLAILTGVLAACQMTPSTGAAPQDLPEGYEQAVVSDRELLTDEFGSYRTASARAAIADDGVLIRVEERYYVDSSQARFVVMQKNLSLRHAGPGISAMHLSLHRGGSTVATTDLSDAATAASIPQELYTTAFFPSNMSREALIDRTCAVLDVVFTDETWYPLSLNTCDLRSLRLLSND